MTAPLTAATGSIQLLFTLMWVAYATCLPLLLERAGIDKSWTPWFIALDQVIFVVLDIVMGFGSARILRSYPHMATLLVPAVVVSALLLVALPVLSTSALLLVPALLLWVATAPVLQAPVMGLFARHVPPATRPLPMVLAMGGVGIAGAAAPYVQAEILKISPLLTFSISAGTLVLAALALAGAERLQPAPPPPSAHPWTRYELAGLAAVLVGVLGLSIGFQLHTVLRQGALFTALDPQADLGLLLPFFWVGFSIAAGPVGLSLRVVPAPALAMVSALGFALFAGLSTMMPSIPLLTGAQFLAGVAWAGAFLGGMTTVASVCPAGRESIGIGLWFAMAALATAARAAFVATGGSKVVGNAMIDLTFPGYVLAGAMCFGAAWVLSWLKRRQTAI